MTAVDVGVQLRCWITKAIDDAAMGEEFGFDIDWEGAAAGPGGMSITYNIYVTMRNPLLGGGPLLFPIVCPITAMQEDKVRHGIQMAMGQLRKLHRQTLEQGAAGNGVSPN